MKKKTSILRIRTGLFSLVVFCYLLNPIAKEKEYCIKKDTNYKMNLSEAEAIAKNTDDCKKVGKLKKTHWCNEISGTWWIMLETDIKNCSPACVVDVEKKTASVNYMCTGLRILTNKQVDGKIDFLKNTLERKEDE